MRVRRHINTLTRWRINLIASQHSYSSERFRGRPFAPSAWPPEKEIKIINYAFCIINRYGRKSPALSLSSLFQLAIIPGRWCVAQPFSHPLAPVWKPRDSFARSFIHARAAQIQFPLALVCFNRGNLCSTPRARPPFSRRAQKHLAIYWWESGAASGEAKGPFDASVLAPLFATGTSRKWNTHFSQHVIIYVIITTQIVTYVCMHHFR